MKSYIAVGRIPGYDVSKDYITLEVLRESSINMKILFANKESNHLTFDLLCVIA